MPLLALAYLAFIGLGLPDPLPGSLWPEIGPDYRLSNTALGGLLIGLSLGYMGAGLLAGRAISAIGVGGVLVLSLVATALAAGGAALAPPWPVFLALGVLAGVGGGAVDAGLNAFAAARFKPRHMNWLHGCYGIGAALGPAVAAALLAAGFGWQAGYAAVALALAALAACFALTRSQWDAGAPAAPEIRATALSVLRNRTARLQMLIFFVYTGLEAGAGQWAATVLTARGASPAEGAAAATAFWAALAAGRFSLGLVVDRLGPDRLLRLAAPASAVAALAFVLGFGAPALAAISFALAPIYPTLMARTPGRLGAAAAVHAVGFQVSAAMAGAGLLPAAMGAAADLLGPEAVPPALALLAVTLTVLVWRLPARG